MVFLIWWLYCCWKVKSNACKPQNLYRWVSLYQTEKLLVLQWKLWRSLCGGKYTNSVLCFFLAVHHSLKKLDGVGYWSLLKFTSFQIMLLKQVKSMWFIMYVFFLDFSSSPSARRHLTWVCHWIHLIEMQLVCLCYVAAVVSGLQQWSGRCCCAMGSCDTDTHQVAFTVGWGVLAFQTSFLCSGEPVLFVFPGWKWWCQLSWRLLTSPICS